MTAREQDIKKLVIVIPAYKAKFLRETLESIAWQTDKRFTVYVGDDASPDNIKEICDDFTDRFDLFYKRFDENLGHISLVGHWNRCIELSSEPWTWLFCDDDVMESGCVEMFYETIEREGDTYSVLRFNTITINDAGEVRIVNPPHPFIESGGQFIYHRLKYERLSYVSEYIFSRKAFQKNNGMVDFPIGYCSDDASWLAFSGESGILTIQGAYVFWRWGAYNITPSGAKYQSDRIKAIFSFVNWLDEFTEKNGTGNRYLTRDMIKNLSQSWFLRQVKGVAPISVQNFSKTANFIKNITQKNMFYSCFFILRINLLYYLTNKS